MTTQPGSSQQQDVLTLRYPLSKTAPASPVHYHFTPYDNEMYRSRAPFHNVSSQFKKSTDCTKSIGVSFITVF